MSRRRTNPYDELDEREHIVFRRASLPDGVLGVYWPRGDRAAVIVDADLDPAAQRATVAHELVHDERGGGVEFLGQPASWDSVVSKEEQIVEREVACWLLPRRQLVEFITRQLGVEVGVTVDEVAEHFEVPHDVAERALRLLADHPEGWDVV